jgi:hypothetical protein
MNNADEVDIGAMIYLLNFIKTGSGIRKLIDGGIHRHTGSMEIAYVYFCFRMRKGG